MKYKFNWNLVSKTHSISRRNRNKKMGAIINLNLFLFSIKYFISHLNNQAGTSERYCCGGV
jgi:hypothetical protein